jgi:sugar O-acyltransferase (sialic acid O-acetyltransferase NeuD family)
MSQAGRAVIMGTGGYAVELHGLLIDAGVDIIGFTGPSEALDLPAPRLGPDDAVDKLLPDVSVFTAVADAGLRRRLSEFLRARGRRAAGFAHRTAWIAPTARLEDEVIIYPNSTVHANVRLERGVLVNSNVSIGHHATFGAFCNVNPCASIGGHVRAGEAVYIGMGATVIEHVTIGPGVTVGAGATAVTDLPGPGVYVGTPARRLGT